MKLNINIKELKNKVDKQERRIEKYEQLTKKIDFLLSKILKKYRKGTNKGYIPLERGNQVVDDLGLNPINPPKKK